LFFLMHVIPQFASLLRDSHSDPGWMVRATMGMSDLLVNNQLAFGIAGICFLAAGLLGTRSSACRRTLRRLGCALPGVSGTIELWRTSTLLLNLALLSAQKVPLNTTTHLLEGILGDVGRESMRRVGDKVRRGDRLHSAMSDERLLPQLALRMLAIGESTGELAQVAREGGLLYAHKLDERLSRFAAVVGPVAILAIASLIGGMMVMIMTVLTSVNQMIL
jgi:general secretion pathway protein F